MPETITIDGRGDTIDEAIQEMWDRLRPLEARGFHPITEVEIVDRKTNQILETYQLDDPDLQSRLRTDQQSPKASHPQPERPPHKPEAKEHYLYGARIKLEG